MNTPKVQTYDVYWSPEGRVIATVMATSERAAIRKAPKPYRQYLGEMYAKIKPPKTYVDVDWSQFLTARCTSYIGGASWFRIPAYPNGCVVFACTPIEVRNYIEGNPTQTVRGEFVPDDGTVTR